MIAPAQYMLSLADADNLNRYVEGGGTLLVSFFSAVVDEHDAVHAGGFGAPLEPALGVRVEEHLPLREGATGDIDWNGQTLRADVWQEDLVLAGAEVRATYLGGPAAGEPAITRNHHGAGVGWYVSTRPDAAGLAAIMTAVYADAGVAPADVPAGVEIIRRRRDDAEFVVAINHTTEAVQLPVEGINLLTRTEITGMLSLAGGDVAVIRSPRTAAREQV